MGKVAGTWKKFKKALGRSIYNLVDKIRRNYMKKLLSILVLVGVSAGIVFAAHGGFKDSVNARKSTVAEVLKMNNNAYVMVQGNIVKRLSNDKYSFKDSTGTITVEIDDDEWRGQTITPTDPVKLYGEVDRGIFKTELEINYVEKL